MKKVLVLMSTYNGEKYIKEMIESILKQKDVDLHLLVRDDGSKDDTIRIIREFNNKNITIIKGENIGSTKSFLELIMQAPINYDYYALSDQDDYWQSEKLSNAIKKLGTFKSNQPNLYFSGQFVTDSSLNIISIHKLDTKRTTKASFVFNQIAGCTCVFNLELIKYLKMYFPTKIKGHDNWIFKVCAALDGNIYADENAYILYRQHGNNVIGLKNGVVGKFGRAKQYLKSKNSHSAYAEAILEGYGKYISRDWNVFLRQIIYSKKSLKNRIKLYFRKDIKFHSIYLRIIYISMVFLRRL